MYSRLELLNRVRGYELASERVVDSHVKNLRRKLEADRQHPRIVETVIGAGYRLGLSHAFVAVAVAVAAVAVFAGLMLVSANEEVSSLVVETHRQDAEAVAEAAAQAYETAGGWEGADLSSAAAVAARGQAELTVAEADGAVVAAPASEAAEMMARMHGVEILDVERDDPLARPVVVDGNRVGTVELRFPTSHLPAPEREIPPCPRPQRLVGRRARRRLRRPGRRRRRPGGQSTDQRTDGRRPAPRGRPPGHPGRTR